MAETDPNHTALDGQPLPKIAFDSTSDPASGFEVWRELCRPVFETESREPGQHFSSSYEFVDLQGLVFNRTSYSATRFTRTPQHVRASSIDGLALHFLLRGREVGEACGSSFETGPDKIVLHDWAQPFVKDATAAEQLSVFVPRHLAPKSHRLSPDRPILSWSTGSPAGRLLATATNEIWRSLSHRAADQAPSAAAGYIGLLNGLIELEADATPDAAHFDGVTLAAMKAYLLDHLGDPKLGVDQLMTTFHCSRAKVYRLFSACGGVQAFIQKQRLEACMRELVRNRSSRPVVRLIAEHFGFVDTGYFHRLFKKHFGMTPGDVIRGSDAACVEATSRGNARHDDIGRIHRLFGAATA